MSLEQRPGSQPTGNGRGTYADRLAAAGQEIARLTRRAEQAERERDEARAVVAAVMERPGWVHSNLSVRPYEQAEDAL